MSKIPVRVAVAFGACALLMGTAGMGTQRPIAAQPTAEVGSPAEPEAVARAMLAERGWSDQFECLDRLWERVSGWDTSATNPDTGAYGIPQALPGPKMASAGNDWRTNPATQIEWGLDYVAERYGTPCRAWGFFRIHHYY